MSHTDYKSDKPNKSDKPKPKQSWASKFGSIAMTASASDVSTVLHHILDGDVGPPSPVQTASQNAMRRSAFVLYKSGKMLLNTVAKNPGAAKILAALKQYQIQIQQSGPDAPVILKGLMTGT